MERTPFFVKWVGGEDKAPDLAPASSWPVYGADTDCMAKFDDGVLFI
jgi:hypothetical protein